MVGEAENVRLLMSGLFVAVVGSNERNLTYSHARAPKLDSSSTEYREPNDVEYGICHSQPYLPRRQKPDNSAGNCSTTFVVRHKEISDY